MGLEFGGFELGFGVWGLEFLIMGHGLPSRFRV